MNDRNKNWEDECRVLKQRCVVLENACAAYQCAAEDWRREAERWRKVACGNQAACGNAAKNEEAVHLKMLRKRDAEMVKSQEKEAKNIIEGIFADLPEDDGEVGQAYLGECAAEDLDDLLGDEEADDPVNHPSHYCSHPSGVECIEITKHHNFCIGNAIKYLWRCGLKGSAKQDLEKAVWYIKCELESLCK